jgi:hypothetical protein
MRSDLAATSLEGLPKDNERRAELRSLFPAWLLCLILPVPALLFWHSSDGRNLALGLLFVSCASLVAYSFRRELTVAAPLSRTAWHFKMQTLAMALFAASGVFSAFLLPFGESGDFESLLLAFLIPVPSLCMVPYLTLTTRKPYAAVVFTLFLVACMKLIGGAVVWVVYGPNSVAEGHTRMPMTNPNLLVWFFLISTGALSAAMYVLGQRNYLRMRRQHR